MENSSATLPPPSLLPHLWKTTLISGVLSLAVGVLIVAWPGMSVLVAAIAFGVYLLITGAAQVAFAFALHVSAGSRILLFISGAASLILAVLAFRHFGNAVLLLAIWIGVGFIFRGVATTVSAISDPALPGRGWQIFIGIISLLAGIVVMASPFDSIITLALVVGVWCIVIGVFEIASAFGIRKASQNLR
ncbi:HdeD family acid-resistance protein [Mycobacterium gordonae]|uniref:HdeD family acid-resistance protein n=1 Tax=Mycobacterium gordonae TaxID=1778 RepID=UPI0009F51C5D|nr:HdeD family acid-resistance protein [Mycobacterium gordonae]